MKAFHNDPQVKQKYLERVKAHQVADEITKGTYWKNGKGCAVGCTLHSDDHLAYENELGVPATLAYLEDAIFEKLPNNSAKQWPLRFLESIEVGADLSKVWPKFAVFLLTNSTQCNSASPASKVVSECFMRELQGGGVHWERVLEYAHNYANESEVNYVAYHTAYSMVDKTTSSAYGCVDASAIASFLSDELAVIVQAEKLLELLKECI